jgi:hypothetical protein
VVLLLSLAREFAAAAKHMASQAAAAEAVCLPIHLANDSPTVCIPTVVIDK